MDSADIKVGVENAVEAIDHEPDPDGAVKAPSQASPQLAVVLQENASPAWPDDVKVVVSTAVERFASPRRFFLLEYGDPGRGASGAGPPAWQLQRLVATVDALDSSADAGATYWPVQSEQVYEALLARQLGTFSPSGKTCLRSPCDAFVWALHWLRIITHGRRHWFLEELERCFGTEVVFSFAWNSFYAQWLWGLAAYCVAWQALCLPLGETVAPSGTPFDYVSQGGFILISVSLVLSTWWRFPLRDSQEQVLNTQQKQKRMRRKTMRTPGSRFKLLAVAGLLLLGFAAVVLVTLAIVDLQLYVTYIWAGCADMDPPCTSSQDTKGFAGWLVDVAISLLTSVVFATFYALEKKPAEWIASLLLYNDFDDYRLVRGIIRSSLAVLDKMGLTGVLCFVFAPQWMSPMPDLQMRHFELIFGSDVFNANLQEILTAEHRREMVVTLLKGPFLVSPFIAILMRVVVPRVARSLQRCVRRQSGGSKCCGFVPRVLALLFAYDGDHVGCVRFVAQGPAYRIAEEVAEGKEVEVTQRALWQGMRKGYDPDDVIQDAQQSLIWVFCWTPMMPLGILPTLAAQILLCNVQLTWLCKVRRQPEPEPDLVLRKLQGAFAVQALVTAVGWNVGLHLITYNDDLWRLGSALPFVQAAFLAWAMLAPVSGFIFIKFREAVRPLPKAKDLAGADPAPKVSL